MAHIIKVILDVILEKEDDKVTFYVILDKGVVPMYGKKASKVHIDLKLYEVLIPKMSVDIGVSSNMMNVNTLLFFISYTKIWSNIAKSKHYTKHSPCTFCIPPTQVH